MIKALGVEGASPAPTPGVVTRIEDNEGNIDPELGQEETTMFRAVAAKLNYLSQDRPDITFAIVKLSSKMSRPDTQDLKNMKRLGQFLVGRPRVGCLNGRPIQVHCTPLLTRIGQETDSQESRSAGA